MDSPHVDVVASLKDLVETTSLAVQLGDSMGAIFAHHLHDAIDRQRSAQDGVSERSLFRLTVGFVDLVGFTPISLHATRPRFSVSSAGSRPGIRGAPPTTVES